MKLSIKMQDLILFILIPFLLIATVLSGWMIYSDLYTTILNGFDKKLFAVSTVTSSFIDGEEHTQIYSNIRQIRGLAVDDSSQIMYANVIQNGGIFQYDLHSGEVIHLDIPELDGLGDLAFDSRSNTLYGIDEIEGSLLQIDLEKKESTVIQLFEMECHGLAYDPIREVLYTNNENLITINPQNGETSILGSIGFTGIRGLAYDSMRRTLYGTDIITNQLISINTNTGEGTSIGSLTWSSNPKSVDNGIKASLLYSSSSQDVDDTEWSITNSPLLLGNWGLTCNSTQSILYGGTTAPLIHIDSKTGQISTFENPIIREKESRLYQTYVRRMVSILQKLDLTYLYTCVLEERAKKMRYVLESPQNSPYDIGFVGYEDPDEPEEGIRDSWVKGTVFLSEIIYWEEWGFLKSAYSPIYSKEEIVGLAGADVNISIINKKTNIALIKVLIVGIGSLIIGIMVSLYITRKLIEPISQLKDGALSVAAGKYGQQIYINAPLELENLAASFNKMSKSLKDTIAQLNRSNEELEKRRRSQELKEYIARKIDVVKFSNPQLLAHDYLFAREYSFNASGWIVLDNVFIMWLADSPQNMLKSAKLKNDIADTLTRIYKASDGDWNIMKDRVHTLFTNQLYSLSLFIPEDNEFKTITRRDINAFLVNKGTLNRHGISIQNIILNQTEFIELKSNQMIIVTSADYETIEKSLNSMNLTDFSFHADRVLHYIKRSLSSTNIDNEYDDGIIAVMVGL